MSEPRMHLQAQRLAAALEERRTRARYSCRLNTSCHPVAYLREVPWTGEVVDLSRGGAGLVLGRRFEVGTLLAIELHASDGHPSGTVLARVIHVTPRRDGDWVVGCDFINELTEDEFRALVPDAL